ncbi:zinc finger protein RFP-like [Aquarana catesbeiana]|uniref:zinc finger protein RFP-like n=1 Tax=Aquarana catesbeiana TaxID=8400 RepID=UPI003CC962A6
MASADPSKEPECPICLNIYIDAVTLKCGHDFCQDCIGRVLDTQEGSGGYSCPECREEFQERPELQPNIRLRNIVENLLSARPAQGYFGVFTYYIDTPIPAMISDLNRKCSVHKKLLEYYCTEDSTCICVSCKLDGEHRGHQMETLDEASEMKKGQLRNVLQKLMTGKEETEKRVQSLQEHRRKVQGKADDKTMRVTALFRDLRKRLEELEKRVKSDISGKAERVSLLLSDMIQQLEIKKGELSRKMVAIEELCNMTDPLTVLQKSDTGDLCDTKDGDEDRERHDRLLHDGGDLDLTGISHTLHTGLSDITSWVNVQKCTCTRVYPHSTTQDKDHIDAKQFRRPPQPTPTIQRSHCQAGGPNIGSVQQTSGVWRFIDLLLDVRTAYNLLHISDDRKTVSWSSDPSRPERFQCPQVISSQSFSSGRHYWEVDVGESLFWIVGMCYPSIDRKGDQSQIGCNNKSWGLWRFDNQYWAIYDRKKAQLPSSVSSNRVRIYLDYEAGRISFYDLCDPIRHLFSFSATFTEPLHACLWVRLGSCIKISGGNQM